MAIRWLETAPLNNQLCRTLASTLSSLEGLVKDFDRQCFARNGTALTQLQTTIEDIVQTCERAAHRRKSTSPVTKFCRVLFARTLYCKLSTQVQCITCIVTTLQEKKRKMLLAHGNTWNQLKENR